jgi:hypothetical protein
MHTEDAKVRASEGRELYWRGLSDEEIQSRTARMIEYKRSSEGRVSQSVAMKALSKEYWRDPAYKKKISSKVSSAMRDHWSNPEYHSKMCRIFREVPRNLSDSVREIRRSNMMRLNSRIYDDPHYKDTVCSPLWGKGANAGSRGGIRVSYISKSTESYVFRSLWELCVAIGLDDLGYEWVYEPFTISDDRLRYLPDFYLPSLNLILEVKPEVFIDELSEQKRSLTESRGYRFLYVTDRDIPMIEMPSLEYQDSTVVYKYAVQRLSKEVGLASTLSRVGVK